MGNIPGMPNFPAEDVTRIAGDVMGVFVPYFVKAYPGMLVKHVKEDLARADSDKDGPKFHLRQPPLPTEPLMEGWFEKRGAVRTNWKRRYFVARNAADNFVVHYFAAEADKDDVKKAKGEMHLDGYSVKKVKEEEEQKNLGCGEFGLKMACGRRRAWFVKFENEEQQKEWKAVFKTAAKKARPPMNEDPIMRDSFKVAYHRLRWHFGYWSWWRAAGSEAEMLGMLVVDECNRECMGPTYHELSRMSPTLRRKAESKVQELLDKSVGAVVQAAWKTAMTTLEGMKEPVESKVKEIVGTVVEQQMAFKNQIKDAILSVVLPILEKLANPVMEPVMTHLTDPILNAFVKNMEIFAAHMHELGAKDSSEYQKEIERLLRRADYYWGYMWDAYEKLHKLTRGDTMQILTELCSGIYRWRIEDRIEDDLKLLQKKALFTFWDDLSKEEDIKPETFSAVLAATLEKMAHDTKIVVHEACVQILIDGLSPPFQREVGGAIKDIISPISDAVPDFLKDPPLLDIEALTDELLMDLLTEGINAVVKPVTEPRSTVFDGVAASK